MNFLCRIKRGINGWKEEKDGSLHMWHTQLCRHLKHFKDTCMLQYLINGIYMISSYNLGGVFRVIYLSHP